MVWSPMMTLILRRVDKKHYPYVTLAIENKPVPWNICGRRVMRYRKYYIQRNNLNTPLVCGCFIYAMDTNWPIYKAIVLGGCY